MFFQGLLPLVGLIASFNFIILFVLMNLLHILVAFFVDDVN